MRMKNAFLTTCVALTLAFSAGCGASAAPVPSATMGPAESPASSARGWEQLPSLILREDGYIFDGLPWFSDKKSIMEERKLYEDAVYTNQRLIVPGTLFQDDSIVQKLVYVFQDDQHELLVSGEYLFLVEDGRKFHELAQGLRHLLDKSMDAPMGNDLSVLDEAGITEHPGGSGIFWEGGDGSYLRINLMPATFEDRQVHLLQIKVSSPIPAQETSAP